MKTKIIIRTTTIILTLSMITAFSGCKTNIKRVDSKTISKEYTHRILMVSDMHYTTSLDAAEYNASNPGALASNAAGTAFGYTQEQKIEAILDDISSHQKRENIDAIFVLGDLSLDDYGYRNLAENYLKKFKTDFLDKVNKPWYAVAGNHDSYTNDEWKTIIGSNRQYSMKIGGAAFIMLDTFADAHAESASGSNYVGVDVDFLEKEIKKYPNEPIFLCSHYYKPSASDYKFFKLLKKNERIVCMFRGHTHQNEILAPEEMDYKCICDIGGYAYVGDDNNDFSVFDEDWAWGYTILEWNDSSAHIYHVKKPRNYTASNGTFDFLGAIEDDMTLRFVENEND